MRSDEDIFIAWTSISLKVNKTHSFVYSFGNTRKRCYKNRRIELEGGASKLGEDKKQGVLFSRDMINISRGETDDDSYHSERTELSMPRDEKMKLPREENEAAKCLLTGPKVPGGEPRDL